MKPSSYRVPDEIPSPDGHVARVLLAAISAAVALVLLLAAFGLFLATFDVSLGAFFVDSAAPVVWLLATLSTISLCLAILFGAASMYLFCRP